MVETYSSKSFTVERTGRRRSAAGPLAPLISPDLHVSLYLHVGSMPASPAPKAASPPANGLADCWAQLAGLIALVDHALHVAICEQTARWGFGESAFRLLWACRDVPSEGIPQHELATRLGTSPAHVSQSVEQLRRRGWLIGQRSAADRRRQLWRLTPQGRDVLASVLAELESWAAQCELRFGTAQRKALTVELKRLANSSLGGKELAAETASAGDGDARRQQGGRAA